MSDMQIEEAAKVLGWGRRSLWVFLRDNPTDKDGVPFFYSDGARKMFKPFHIERIRDDASRIRNT